MVRDFDNPIPLNVRPVYHRVLGVVVTGTESCRTELSFLRGKSFRVNKRDYTPKLPPMD